MRLSKLAMGIVSVSTAAIIGTTLWFDRTDHVIRIEDRIELRQGLVERCLATQHRANPPVFSTTVNYVFELESDGNEDQTYFIPDPANTTNQISKPYHKVKGKYVGTANAYTWNGQWCTIEPPVYAGQIISYDYTNKFILGPYSNATVSGFSGDADGLNGDYLLSSVEDGVFYFTNVADVWVTMEYDQTKTTWVDYPFVFIEKPLPPWCVSIARQGQLFEQGGISWTPTVTMSGLATNHIIDAPMFTAEPYSGWPCLPQMDKWEREFAPIDNALFGGCMTGPYAEPPVNPTWATIWRGLLYAPKFIPSNSPVGGDYEHMGFYIKPDKFGYPYTNRYVELPIDVASLWEDVGGTVTNIGGLFDYYAFSDNKIPWFRYGNGNLVTVSQGKYSITREMFTQRYKALHGVKTSLIGAVTDTYPYPHTIKWVRAASSNDYYWHGNATNWDQAVLNAKNHCTTSTVDGPPQIYAQAYFDGYNYYYRAYRRDSILKADCVNSNTQSALWYYVRADPPPDWIVGSITNVQRSFFYDYWEGLPVFDPGYYQPFEYDGSYLNRTNAVASVILGDGDGAGSADPFWPPADKPNTTNSCTSIGWVGGDFDIMADWDFQHCNETIP